MMETVFPFCLVVFHFAFHDHESFEYDARIPDHDTVFG